MTRGCPKLAPLQPLPPLQPLQPQTPPAVLPPPPATAYLLPPPVSTTTAVCHCRPLLPLTSACRRHLPSATHRPCVPAAAACLLAVAYHSLPPLPAAACNRLPPPPSTLACRSLPPCPHRLLPPPASTASRCHIRAPLTRHLPLPPPAAYTPASASAARSFRCCPTLKATDDSTTADAADAAEAAARCSRRLHPLVLSPLPPLLLRAAACHRLPPPACHCLPPLPTNAATAACHHLPAAATSQYYHCRLPLPPPAAAYLCLPPPPAFCQPPLLRAPAACCPPASVAAYLPPHPAAACHRRLLPQPGSTGPSYLTLRMHANAACLPPTLPAPPAYRCHLPIATAAVCLMLLSAACLPPPTACCRPLLYPGTTRGPCLPWPACQPLLTAACTCYLLPAACACLPLAPGTGCPHCRPPLQPPSSCHLPPPPASAVFRRFLPPPPDTTVAASCCRLPAVCRLLPACGPSCLRPTASCRPCLHRLPLPHTDAHYPGTYRCRHLLLIRLLPLLPGASAAAER
ncbi:uncharacterized protein LOC135363453 [Mirounga angustirostris]|uniref:uncharacterized protein LOC135363453 n=1 Tax=Mirounga angustirostris TaxID=9716 RepID=UPI00313F1539